MLILYYNMHNINQCYNFKMKSLRVYVGMCECLCKVIISSIMTWHYHFCEWFQCRMKATGECQQGEPLFCTENTQGNSDNDDAVMMSNIINYKNISIIEIISIHMSFQHQMILQRYFIYMVAYTFFI